MYDKVLLVAQAGVGKGCMYISVAEYNKYEAVHSRIGLFTDALLAYQQAYQGLVKHVYVLLKSSLVEEFKRKSEGAAVDSEALL